MMENLRGEKFPRYNFQYIYHLSGFLNAFHTLQRNKAPHGKEYLSHAKSSDESDIE
jgi:hypothetical protein